MRGFKPHPGKLAFGFLSGIAAEPSGTGLRGGDGCRSLGKGLPGCVTGWFFQSGFGVVVRHRFGFQDCGSMRQGLRLRTGSGVNGGGCYAGVLLFSNKGTAVAVVIFSYLKSLL